jgi:LysR family glycine cleavage system transcriptional activator
VLKTSRAVQDFRRDAIDVAIRFAPAPGRGLQGELLCREELFPVASPQLFRGGRIPDTLAALCDYPLLHDIDANPDQPWLGWRGWFERAGLPTAVAGRGPQFNDSVVLVGAAVAGLGIAIGRGPHVAPLLARGQLVRVTPESWIAPWSYYLMAPPAHFRRPLVRAFIDWALEEARADSGAG